MKRTQNVIIFSAGESVRNGTVPYISEKLRSKGINCCDWRSLFNGAHDLEHIALLPALAKKIPTFDFALVVAEGVDKVKVRGNEVFSAMRDNVIFELGLCVMALGVERVILLAEESVRIPEDLIGVGKIALEYIRFSSDEIDKAADDLSSLIEDKLPLLEAKFTSQIEKIFDHINTNADLISPVFVGAAVSSAEAYFLNFVIRFLENMDNGFSPKGEPENVREFPKEFYLDIIIPAAVSRTTRSEISDYYSTNGYSEFVIQGAGVRELSFYGIYDEKRGVMSAVDVPTSITASYSVVNSVLNMDSDSDYDVLAEERFVTKEMDVYSFALSKLLNREVAEKRLSFIKDAEKKEKILSLLGNVSVHITDILSM